MDDFQDDVDGCAEDFTEAPQVADDELDYLVLFASVAPEAIEEHRKKWETLWPTT